MNLLKKIIFFYFNYFKIIIIYLFTYLFVHSLNLKFFKKNNCLKYFYWSIIN